MRELFHKPSLLLAVFLCLAVGWSLMAAAAGSPLRVEFVPQVARPRTAAPIPVEVRLKWDGASLLEGRLEMEFRDSRGVFSRYLGPELALTAGEQRFRWLLPPLPETSDSQIEVRLWFRGVRERIALPTHAMTVAPSGERSLVVAFCTVRETVAPQRYTFEQSLRLEHYLENPDTPQLQRPLTTTAARLTPDILPATALAYCAYDIVVLEAGVLIGLGERQRQALQQWVAAGGSLCVFTAEHESPEVCETLNALCGAMKKFRLGPDARVDPRAITFMRQGLGRVAVVAKPFNHEADVESAAWRQAVAFLWKLRPPVSLVIERGARVNAMAMAADQQRVAAERVKTLGYNYNYSQSGVTAWEQAVAARGDLGVLSYAVQTSLGRDALLQRLMPQSVRLMPRWTMAGMLALLIALIGPVDWWVLGWLKRRRYTWLLFPTVILAISGATVALANHYMGQGEQRRALTVVDLGETGAVLRQDRYELLFSSHDGPTLSEQRQALWSSLPTGMDTAYYPPNPGAYRPGEGDGGEGVEGTVPLNYRARTRVRQWEPRMSRSFSVEPTAAAAPVKWAVVDEYLRGQGTRDPKHLCQLLRRSCAVPADVMVYHADAAPGFEFDGAGILGAQHQRVMALFEPDPRGLFLLTSQLSPTGGANFEDLHVFDPTAPDQWQVVVVVKAGADFVAYRRVYHVK